MNHFILLIMETAVGEAALSTKNLKFKRCKVECATEHCICCGMGNVGGAVQREKALRVSTRS